ncbi:MAG: CPBP family intramembrane glutamic endopeptidase [Massiliimalia sp.]|jgi:membrane protease YdiL (CAAX protease family)
MKQWSKRLAAVLIYYVVAFCGFWILYQFGIDYAGDKIHIYAIPMMIVLCGYVFVINKKRIFQKKDFTFCPENAGLNLIPYVAALGVAVTWIEAIVRNMFAIDLLFITILTFLIGIGEEGMFRKYLLDGEEKTFVGKIGLFVFSVVTFSLLHMMNVAGGLTVTGAWIQSLSAVPFGIVAGILYWKTKNLSALIFWHMMVDYFLFISVCGTFYSPSVLGLGMDVILISALIRIVYQEIKSRIARNK